MSASERVVVVICSRANETERASILNFLFGQCIEKIKKLKDLITEEARYLNRHFRLLSFDEKEVNEIGFRRTQVAFPNSH